MRGVHEFYIAFYGPAFNTWRALGLLDARRPVVSLLPVSHWQARLKSVLDTPSDAPAPPGGALQVCRWLTLLTEIVTQTEAQTHPSPHAEQARRDLEAWAVRACALLGENLSAPDSAPQFAAKLAVSEAALRRKFRQARGMAPMRFRALRRMDAACDLLRCTDLTHAQIADTLGFTDEYHFSRRFKQLKGEPPALFRRRFRV